MLNFMIKYRLALIGILIGATAGFAYYYFIGCVSGKCLITSSPVNSTLYGAVLGGVSLNAFRKENFSKKQ